MWATLYHNGLIFYLFSGVLSILKGFWIKKSCQMDPRSTLQVWVQRVHNIYLLYIYIHSQFREYTRYIYWYTYISCSESTQDTSTDIHSHLRGPCLRFKSDECQIRTKSWFGIFFPSALNWIYVILTCTLYIFKIIYYVLQFSLFAVKSTMHGLDQSKLVQFYSCFSCWQCWS